MNEHKSTGKRKSWFTRVMKYVVPLVVSVGLCIVLFRDIDFADMMQFIKSDCDFRFIGLSMLLGVACILFRAMRWRIQLEASGIKAPFMPVAGSIAGTYAVNLVFPRLGEIWRSEYIARRQQAPFPMVFGSMLAERLTDTLVVGLMTLSAFFVGGHVLKRFFETKVDHDGLLYQLVASPWTYIAGVVLALLLIAAVRHNARANRNGKVATMLHNLWSGMMSIFHIRGGWRWILLTVLLWGSYFGQMLACFEAFGMTREIMSTYGLSVVYLCYVLGSLSMAVPSNGGIGPYQIAVVFGLQCFVPDLDKTEGYSFASVVLGAQTLLFIVLGLITFISITIANHRHR